MLNEKIAELLNQQINKEFYSAYLYLDFSNYFYDAGLDGFGNWYKIQAQEERDHAMLILRYMQMNGMKVTLDAIEKPSVELTSNLGVLDVELANGIRLILKPTPDKSGELLLTSLAPGSLSALTEEEFFEQNHQEAVCFNNLRYCPPFLHRLEFIKIIYNFISVYIVAIATSCNSIEFVQKYYGRLILLCFFE